MGKLGRLCGVKRTRRSHPKSALPSPAALPPAGEPQLAVPPVLPIVRVLVRSNDDVEVSVDGEVQVSGPISRSALGQVVSTIVAERGVPVRVELTEADARQFADIVLPEPARSVFAPPPTAPAPTTAPPAPTPVPPPPAASPVGVTPPLLYRVSGEGFVPGEDVAVAVIVRATSADQEGIAQALVDSRELPEQAGGVLLFGYISGTLTHEGIRR